MPGVQRSALVVAVDEQVFETVSKLLSGIKFFADFAESGSAALESISFLPFDAIVTGYPLPDMQMQAFLDAVRKPDSPCRQSAVVVLALRGLVAEVEPLVGKGANRVLAIEDYAEALPRSLFGLLEVPPRFAMRTISRLKVQLSWGTSQTICQTENISAHGMLIKTDHPYPIGTQMAFDVSVPGDSNPIRGYAVVVRQTQEKRERVTGLGVRFSSFHGDDKKRLEAALAKLKA